MVFAGLISNRPADALLIGSLIAVTLVDYLAARSLHRFSNTGMLTVGALYLVAAGLRETGALDTLGSWVLGRAKSERGY
jgi:hypothetical protein